MRRLQAGVALVGAVQSGWQRLESQREELNQMNVFPVPDGDTGENMSMTLRYALTKAKQDRPVKLPEAARSLAEGALQGARGNSGVILSQLFRGFAQSLGDRQRFTSEAFVVGLAEAYRTAFQAISQPLEGTILSVVRASAEGARVGLEQSPSGSWRAVFAAALNASVEALFHTPNQLPQLRQAGVVDAGGQGWLYFLEGVADFVLGGRAVMDWKRDPRLRALRSKTWQPSQHTPFAIEAMEKVQETDLDLPVDSWFETLAAFKDAVPYPYDLEFLLVAPGLTPTEVEHALRPLGDSLIVSAAKPGETIKVHIHARDLAPIFQYACTQGELIDLHLQNMRQQAVRAQQKQMAASDGLGQQAGQPFEAPKVRAIAFTSGEGFTRMFRQAGAFTIHLGDADVANHDIELDQADRVRLQAQLMASIHRPDAEELLLLPNRVSLLPLVEQAAQESGRDVTLVPTSNQAEGLAALLTLDAEAGLHEQLPAIRAAVSTLRSGVLTPVNGGWQGWAGESLVAEGEEKEAVLLRLVDAMWEEGQECLVLYTGLRTQTEEAEAFAERIRQKLQEAQVDVLSGGQEDSDILVVIE